MTTVSPRRIVIFDTTLRDGEQSPGCSMNLEEKLEVAQALGYVVSLDAAVVAKLHRVIGTLVRLVGSG